MKKCKREINRKRKQTSKEENENFLVKGEEFGEMGRVGAEWRIIFGKFKENGW